MIKLYFDRLRPITQTNEEPKTHGGKSEKFRTITNEELEKIREFIDDCDYVGLYEYIGETGEKTPNINTYQEKIENHLLNNNYKSLYKYAIYNMTGNSTNNDEQIDTMEYEEEKNERQEKEKKDFEDNKKVYLYLDLDIDDNNEYHILDNNYYHHNKNIYKVHSTRRVKKTNNGYKVYYPQTIEKEYSDWYINGMFYKRYLSISKDMLFISDNIKTNKLNTIIEELEKGPKTIDFIEKYFRTIGYSIEWCLIFRDKYQKEQVLTTEEEEEEQQTSIEELTSVFFNHINNNATTEEQTEEEEQTTITDALYDELNFVTVKENKVVNINNFRPAEFYCKLLSNSYKLIRDIDSYKIIDLSGMEHDSHEVLTYNEPGRKSPIQIYKIIERVKDTKTGILYNRISLGVNKEDNQPIQRTKRDGRWQENQIDDVIYIYNQNVLDKYKMVSNYIYIETEENHYLFEKYENMEVRKQYASKKDLINLNFIVEKRQTNTIPQIEMIAFYDIPFFNKNNKNSNLFYEEKDYILNYYIQELMYKYNVKTILRVDWDWRKREEEEARKQQEQRRQEEEERRKEQERKQQEQRRQEEEERRKEQEQQKQKEEQRRKENKQLTKLIQIDIDAIRKTSKREKESRKPATNEQILQALFR